MNKAIFFDKDGIINHDIHPVDNLIEPIFLKGIEEIIAYVRKLGYMTIIITNQSIIARGMIAEIELAKLFNKYKKRLEKINKNAVFDGIYYCPHHPNADIEIYRIKCECRKPKPGMIKKACADYDINPKNSYFVGDRITDIIAGYLAKCNTILCRTGKHDEKMIETDLIIKDKIEPNYIIDNIHKIKDIIS